MKNIIVAFLVVLALATPAYAFTREIMNTLLNPHLETAGSVNGGSKCAACTLVMALAKQTMQAKDLPPAEAFKTLCGYLPKGLDDFCNMAVGLIGPSTYEHLSSGETPDEICNALGSCKAETAVCRLFPPRRGMSVSQYENNIRSKASSFKVVNPIDKLKAFNICTIVPGVCRVEQHLPFSDNDDDRFSTEPTLRGSDWRGKDCNDADRNAYPGRESTDATRDQNCNGIYGVNPVTGLNYEDELCGGTNAMGVATMGDSASAHFRLPEELMMPGKHSKADFASLLSLLTNEADWPHLSWATGHRRSEEYAPSISGPMISIYSRLRELNRCNHRDYQNLGVNGARVAKLTDWVKLLARNRNTDKPILAFFAMIGNDVCNGRPDFSGMTTPEKFYESVLEAVLAADAKFPKNSVVILAPLVDGRILYDEMSEKIHPLGDLNQDVTYRAFYDFLNCLETSPCWGWMNSDAGVRNKTYEIASSLNAQLPKVAEDVKNKVRNIKVYYSGELFSKVVEVYPGPKSDLIEPVDGFHPSQAANAYLANVSFNFLLERGIISKHPNPNNARIEQLFGDQGGH